MDDISTLCDRIILYLKKTHLLLAKEQVLQSVLGKQHAYTSIDEVEYEVDHNVINCLKVFLNSLASLGMAPHQPIFNSEKLLW
jgi:hypothetical protein